MYLFLVMDFWIITHEMRLNHNNRRTHSALTNNTQTAMVYEEEKSQIKPCFWDFMHEQPSSGHAIASQPGSDLAPETRKRPKTMTLPPPCFTVGSVSNGRQHRGSHCFPMVCKVYQSLPERFRNASGSKFPWVKV